MTVFQEVVKAVRTEYPKFSPACLSLSMRTYETGVQMTPRAKTLAEAVQGHQRLSKRFSENRAKNISFRCRMCLTDAELVKHKMEAEGVSQQELIERLLLEWAKKEPSPVVETGNGLEVGADAEASPSSENITDCEGGQE